MAPAFGATGEGGAGKADDVHRMRDARRIQRDFHRAPVDVVGARERGRRRQLRDDDEIAAVELRDEADRRLAEFIEPEGDDAGIDHQHQHGDAHRARRQPAIAPRQGVEVAIERRGRSRGSACSTSGRPRARACGLSSSAQSAGDSVSDTVSEMIVAPAMVSANCR